MDWLRKIKVKLESYEIDTISNYWYLLVIISISNY